MPGWLRQQLKALLRCVPPLYRLRERAAELQKANAQLRHELKRLLVFDRAPGRVLTPILAERAQMLRLVAPADASPRDRAFADRTPVYRDARNRLRTQDPANAQAVDVFGLTMWVPNDACTVGSLSARILTGRWLPVDDIARVRRVIVGGTMLDVGANIGTTAIPRLALGDFAVVYAAEPHPANYECLVANALRNGLEGRLLPDRVAISSWDGEGRLRESRQIGGHHLLLSNREKPGSTGVTCLTLDRWVERLGISARDITFVKVDVQGWDAHVLLGAPVLRAYRHIAWQIELSPKLMRHAGIDVRVLCGLTDATFTHMQQLDAGAEIARPVSELPALLETMETRGRFTNVLLYNQAAAPAVRLSA